MAQRAPLAGRQPETPRECVRVSALIAEADFQRDIAERQAWIGQQAKRRIEPQTLQIAMRRFAEGVDKKLMKAPHAEAAMRGQVGDTQRLRQMRAQPAVDAREVEAGAGCLRPATVPVSATNAAPSRAAASH